MIEPAKSAFPRQRLWFALSFTIVLPLLFYAAWVNLVVTPGAQRQAVLDLPFESPVEEVRAGEPSPRNGAVYFDTVVTARITALPRHVIADIGDVRIALRRFPGPFQLFSAPVITAPVMIATNRPDPALTRQFSETSGGVDFTCYTVDGMTTCELNVVRFTIQSSTLSIHATRVPIGRGPRIVFLDETGAIEEMVVSGAGGKK